MRLNRNDLVDLNLVWPTTRAVWNEAREGGIRDWGSTYMPEFYCGVFSWTQ